MHQIGLPGRVIVTRFIINIPTYYMSKIVTFVTWNLCMIAVFIYGIFTL